MAGSEAPASLGIAHLHLQIALGQMGRGDVLRLSRVQYSPTCQPSLSTCMQVQTYKDSGIWRWGDLPLVHGPPTQLPSPAFLLPLSSLKKKSCTYPTILNTAGQSSSIFLREKQSLTAQLHSASLSWKINQHIQVYSLLGGKIQLQVCPDKVSRARWSFQIPITLLVHDQNEA